MTLQAISLHYSKIPLYRGTYEISTSGSSGADGDDGRCAGRGDEREKTFAAENLLNKVKERGTLLVGLEGTYPPFSFQGDDGKLTGFEVEFAQELAKHSALKPPETHQMGRDAGVTGFQTY